MSDTSPGEGWWLAADGKWYPPESAPPSESASADPSETQETLSQKASSAGHSPATAPQNNLAGFIAVVGWAVMAAGFAVILATLSESNGMDGQFGQLSSGGQIIALSSGFMVLGVGAAATALGGILREVTRG